MNNVAGEADAMPFLRLSEAAAQCARETDEQVTSDWLLQFAGKGQLKIFFIARTVIPLEGGALAGTSITYKIGDYINLPPEWASWMHGSIEKPRTVKLSLLLTPSGPRYITNALTGKRITIEVREEDLYVSFEEISSMASTLLERRRKANEESKPLLQKLERMTEEKRNAGRYTLKEAALVIAEKTDERKEIIIKKLEAAAEKYELHTYEPGKNAKIRYGSGPGEFSGVRAFHDEVFWDDLNKWLAENEPRISCRFPAPSKVEMVEIGSLPYMSLQTLFESFLNTPRDKLPELLCQRLAAMSKIIWHLWDELSPEGRKEQLGKIDFNYDPAHQVERTAGRLMVFMDTNAWSLAESISPINAAMLLSGRNPNTQKVDDAETNTNDEMGPNDFRRLKNIFEGASKDKQRMLKDWKEYAQQRGLKIHSWINDWEAWVREVDTRQAQQAAPVLPVTQAATTERQAVLKKSAADSDYEVDGQPPLDLIPLSAALSTLSTSFGATAGELAMWVCTDHALSAWSTTNGRVGQRFQNADLKRLLEEKDDSIVDALIALDTLKVQVSTSMVAKFNPDSTNRYWDYETAQKFIQDTVNNVDVEKKILKRWQRTHDNLRGAARTNGQLQIAAHIPGIGFAESIEKGLVIEGEFRAFVEQASRLVSTTGTQAAPRVSNTSQRSPTLTENPWLIKDLRDLEPPDFQPWYTPARYFARELVKDDSTLLTKRDLLAEKVVKSLSKIGEYGRGKKKKKSLSSGTVKKAFVNVNLS